jgi:hypothetical protein
MVVGEFGGGAMKLHPEIWKIIQQVEKVMFYNGV